MSLRIASFNVENLMHRFDFSGYRNELYQDRALSLYEIKDEEEYQRLEQARTIAQTDDARQLSALAIAATRADIVCLQEVDNLEALNAFEYSYLYKMIGSGYQRKYHTAGNDSRGIDVAVMMRDETRTGEVIEFVNMTSHAHLTYQDFDLYDKALQATGNDPTDRIFRRDCLEIDLRIGGKAVTLYTVHFKSMGSPRDGITGREFTMPIRAAEAKAVRRVIEDRFGAARAPKMRWLICGDINDYRERTVITGDEESGYRFLPAKEEYSSLDELLAGGFTVDPTQNRPELDRWTLYHTRGPQERHLCQLDYILLSPALAARNAKAVPDIIRRGQPWRTIMPPGQETDRYPRTGWDRPKASDHCPVAITIDLI